MRASDAEREATADRLRHAAGEGRLDVEELDARLQQAYSATTNAELERLTHDVPAAQRTPDTVAVGQAGGEGSSWVVGIMSGASRKGRWKVAPRCRVLAVMGGADLDFEHATFSSETVEIRVVAIMGGVEIKVPEGLNVEVSDLNIMGGTDIKIDDPHPSPGGPTLRVKIFTLMGGAGVKRRNRRGTTSP